MSYMEEWQKQQKAFKDADRKQKKGAANILSSYRGTTQQESWQKLQKELKDADRRNREAALASLKKYKGGEHDVKEYQRMIATYRKQLVKQKLEQQKLQELDPDMPDEMMTEESWQQHIADHIADFEKMIVEHGFKDFKELDNSSKRHPSRSFAEAMGPPDAQSHDFDSRDSTPEDADQRPVQERLSKGLPSGQSTETESIMVTNADVSGSDMEPGQKTAEDKTDADSASIQIEATSQSGRGPISVESCKPGNDKEDEKEGAAQLSDGITEESPKAEDAENSHSNEQLLEVTPKKSRSLKVPPSTRSRLIDLDFSFGIIYPNSTSPAPTIDKPTIDRCSSAAASIVPVSLKKTLRQTLPTAIWDSDLRPVIKCVELDHDYKQPGSIRYVVRGSVPVHLAICDIKSPTKRRLSREDDLLMGNQDEQQWRLVRGGNCPDWESILATKMGLTS